MLGRHFQPVPRRTAKTLYSLPLPIRPKGAG
jgi:hypothetical protein